MWSKHLVPKPKDWESHIDVVGFFLDKSVSPLVEAGAMTNPWNNKPIDGSLPEIVRQFLLNGPPPIFVGFGSMVVDNPLALIQVFNPLTSLLTTPLPKGLYRSCCFFRGPNYFPIRMDGNES